MTASNTGAVDTRAALIEALDRYLRQDETAGDIDNGVYRNGLEAMSAALSAPASVAEAPSEPAKYWCDTCEGTGSVYQEHQAGCHVGGDHPCPDCDGNGYWHKRAAPYAAAPSAALPVAEVIECPKMGQQTLKEIDGRWKFLAYGTLLYAGAAPSAATAQAVSAALPAVGQEAGAVAEQPRKAWKITVASGLSHRFTEDDDEVKHFSHPDRGHKVEEYILAAPGAAVAAREQEAGHE